MWKAIKVVLQLRLYELFGEVEGKIFYKVIILMVVNELCDKIVVSSDIKLQKLARRLYKLDLLIHQTLDKYLLKQLISAVTEIIYLCAKTIANVKRVLNSKFESVVSNSRELSSELNMKNIDAENDKYHILHSLIKIMNSLNKNNNSSFDSNIPIPDYCIRNKIKSFQIPDLNHFNSSKCFSTALYDIECWIQEINLKLFVQNENTHAGYINSFKLKDLIINFIQKASEFYKSDELANSRMILICNKIVCLLD